MYSHGFLKVAAASIKTRLGDCMSNAKEVVNVLNSLNKKKPAIICFPEMCIPGYSIGDLVFQQYMYNDSLEAIKYCLENTTYDGIYIIGSFLVINDAIYNCAFVCQNKEILGIVPKNYLPHTNEFYETRWFAPGVNIQDEVDEVCLFDKYIPFGKIIFENNDGNVMFGAEVCADMWAPISPNEKLFANGALIVFNASASPANIGKRNKRRMLTEAISLKLTGAYVYVSTNASESTSEVVFSGHKIISENGVIVSEDDKIDLDNSVIYADIDIAKLHNLRKNNGYFKSVQELARDVEILRVGCSIEEDKDYVFEKKPEQLPFVPKNPRDFEEIIDIQATSVIKRLDYVGTKKVVIGVSGGLDSTLALLSLVHAYDKYNIPRENIIGIRLPSEQNSSKTYLNSKKLMEKLKITAREISITEGVKNQLAEIGHDGKTKDVTFENVQARYRTFCLMNTANLEQAIVIGTSDMSEIALGWCTFNGDHMAMYGINAGVTKTVVRETVRYYTDIYPEVKEELLSVIGTPISPELSGTNQLTEDVIGKYEINDFILYHFLVNGDDTNRIAYLLGVVFNIPKSEATKLVKNFNKRFYSQQYKRLTMPEGAKVLSISLSPRTEIRLNGDLYRPE